MVHRPDRCHRHWSWLLVVAALAAGCGSAQKSADVSSKTLKEDGAAGANYLTELNVLEEELERQRALDAALLSPEQFASAERSVRSARGVEKEQGRISELRANITSARNALQEVRTRSDALREPLSPALEARNDAVIGGAAGSESFRETDDDLRSLASGLDPREIDRSRLDRKAAELRDRYRRIEIAAIRNRYLSEVYALHETARTKESDKFLPGVYQGAVAALRRAEDYIEHNPYDARESSKRAAEAAFEARRLISLSDRAQWIRQQPVEEVVLWVESRANELRQGVGLGDLRDRGLDEQFDVVAAGVSSMDFTNEQLSMQNEEMRSRLGRQGEAESPEEGAVE